MTVRSEDLLLVNRAGVDYQTEVKNLHTPVCDLEDLPGPSSLPPDDNTIYKLVTGSIVEPLDTPDGGYDGGTIVWWRNLSIGSVVPCIFPGAFAWQAATLKILETKTYTIVGNPQTAPSKFEVISGGAGFPSPAETVKLGKGTDDFSFPAIITGVNWSVERM